MLDLYLQMYDVSYFEARGRHKPLGLYGGGEVDLKQTISGTKNSNLFARCLVTGALLVPPTTRDNETIQGRDTLAAPRLLRRVRPTRSQSSSRWAHQTNRPVLAPLFSLRSYYEHMDATVILTHRQEIPQSCATMVVTPTGSWPGELNFQPEFDHLCLQVGSKTRSSL